MTGSSEPLEGSHILENILDGVVLLGWKTRDAGKYEGPSDSLSRATSSGWSIVIATR